MPLGGGRQVDQLELAQGLVVRGHLALALKDVDLHRRLAVLGGGEDLALAGGDGGVALDQGGHHAALGLDAQRQRGHVEQQHVLDLALEHAGLDGGADGHDLVGVHGLVGLAAGHLLHQFGHCGHPGRPAHQDHVVDVALGDPGVGDGPLEGAPASVEEGRGQFLELGPAQRVVEVQRTLVGGRHEGQVDLGRWGLGQLDLGLLGRLLETLHGHRVRRQVHAVVAPERRHQPVDHGPRPQSSPPSLVSPAVDFTSKTPSPSSSTDTSKVPPPRSKTRMVWSAASLSSP